jgi:hypothetical protein
VAENPATSRSRAGSLASDLDGAADRRSGAHLHPRVTRRAQQLRRRLADVGVSAWGFDAADGLRRVVCVRDGDARRAVEVVVGESSTSTVFQRPGTHEPRPVRELPTALIDGERRFYLYDPAELPPDYSPIADRYACELQIWRQDGAFIEAPAETPYGRVFRDDGLEGLEDRALLDTIVFPIDAVYTWVDDSDPAWQDRRARRLENGFRRRTDGATAASRYRSRDELRYSLRSLEEFAPWIRHVYLVTDDQVPGWLREEVDWITVVDHRDIFRDPAALPTFNSHAIEAQLHRVPGLSEHFLYLNDDFFFARPVGPRTFFHANGLPRFFFSSARIPWGEPLRSDPGVDAAAKNGRRIVWERYGVRLVQKFKHAPQALRRTFLEHLEQAYPEISVTAHHPVRALDDVSLPSSFAHHIGYLEGLAVPGSIAYDYFGLDDLPRVQDRFTHLLEHRDLDVFCIADADLPPAETALADEMIDAFMRAYYPLRGSFERSDARSGG